MANCYNQKQFFDSKCFKVFGDWAPPGPRGEAYSAPPDLLAGFKEAALRKGGQKRNKGGGIIPPTTNSWIRHCLNYVYDDYLEAEMEGNQNCSVLCCVWQLVVRSDIKVFFVCVCLHLAFVVFLYVNLSHFVFVLPDFVALGLASSVLILPPPSLSFLL